MGRVQKYEGRVYDILRVVKIYWGRGTLKFVDTGLLTKIKQGKTGYIRITCHIKGVMGGNEICIVG